MPSSLTRFEVVLPNTDNGTPQQTAVNDFIDSLVTLCDVEMYSAYIYPKNSNHSTLTSQNILYGLLSSGQQSTALGFLTTLNSALGTTVPCFISTVTTEP